MTASISVNDAWLPVAFRDTALTVATLGGQTEPSSFDAVRKQCCAQIARLRAELKAAREPEDVIEDAIYAQCALLDEAALSHLKEDDRDAWEREPLQVTEFGSHDAGDALIARMQQRLRQPQPVLPLLAIFHAVLTTGFRGRFAWEGADVRAVMIRVLSERLGATKGPSGGGVVHASGGRHRFGRLSLPAGVLLALAAAGLAWVLLDRWLGAAAAHLLL